MADLPTRTELFRRWRNAALAVPDTRISPREIDRPGSDANLLCAASAIMGEEIVARMARALQGAFESTAKGTALDRVIFDRKGLTRLPATPAIGTVSLTRPTFAAGGGTVDGGLPGSTPSPTRIVTNRGIVYILTEPAVFGATALGPVVVTIQAELAGLQYEIAEDQAWNWVDTPFDPTIVIANPDETAGASDEETDSQYLARSRSFFPTLRRGTIGAIAYGLRSTPGVASASVEEVVAPTTGYPACFVNGYVIDETGQSNSTLAAKAQLQLLEYRAAGIPTIVSPSVPQYVDIEFSGTEFDTSIVLDTSAAAALVRARIVSALSNQIPGQVLLRSTIIAAARSVPGFIVDDVDLIEPAAALIPTSTNSVFRTQPDLITIA